jgi:phosphocarrier protein
MNRWACSSITIKHDIGLHARPSVLLTKLAKGFAAAIEVAGKPSGPWIDAKSIVKVMAMKAKRNSTLHVRARGPDAAEAVAAVVDLVERDFEEMADHAARP